MFGEMYRNTMNDDFVKEILKHGWKKNDIYTIESNDINPPKELFDLCSRFSFLSNSHENSWIYSVNYRCVPRQPHPPDVPLMPVPRHSDIWNHL